MSSLNNLATRSWFRGIVMTGFIFAVQGCRGAEDENPGYCRLSCSNTSLAPASFKMTNSSGTPTYKCAGNETFTLTAHWLVTGPIRDGSGESVARAAIGFYVGVANDNAYSIVTPEEEWCSDACGVATVVFTTTCNPSKDSTYSFYLGSGAATSDVIKLTLTKPEA